MKRSKTEDNDKQHQHRQQTVSDVNAEQQQAARHVADAERQRMHREALSADQQAARHVANAESHRIHREALSIDEQQAMRLENAKRHRIAMEKLTHDQQAERPWKEMAWNYPRVFSRMGNYTLASPAVAIQIKSSSMRIKTNSSPLQITSLTIVSTPKMLSIPEYSSKHLILNVYSNYIYLSKPYHYSTTISPPQGLAASAASNTENANWPNRPAGSAVCRSFQALEMRLPPRCQLGLWYNNKSHH